jgi:hypothetical protein
MEITLYSQYWFGVLFVLMIIFGTWRRDIILTVILFMETLTSGFLINLNIRLYLVTHIVILTSLFVFAYSRDVSYRVHRNKPFK